MSRQVTDTPTNIVDTWGIRPGLRVWVGGHGLAAKQEIEKHLEGTERPPTGPLDAALIAPLTTDEALYFAGKLRPRLERGAVVWIVHPTPRTEGGQAFTARLDELVVGMFERGLAEIGRAPLTDQLSTVGFRADHAPDEF